MHNSKTGSNMGSQTTEIDLAMECVPQITELIMYVQEMTEMEYSMFKGECFWMKNAVCPVAKIFLGKVFLLMEMCL